MTCSLRPFQKRLKHTDCSFGSLQKQLQSSAQQPPLSPLGNRSWLHFFQETLRIRGIAHSLLWRITPSFLEASSRFPNARSISAAPKVAAPRNGEASSLANSS